ncbi:MAG: DUF11 domain-containing protein [Bacilli bacterium]|nr:DUF11 domain-containing protein [Bacilli bacterium]
MNEILNTAEIEYQYRIDPTGPDLDNTISSNETGVDLVLGELTMIKSVDKLYATIGEILTYTVIINNIGNILVSNVVFTDILPAEATFVTGSVTVNDTPEVSYHIETGFDLGAMIIGSTNTVTFKAEVTTLPNPNTIINKAETTFNYLVIVPIGGNSESNTVTTTINVSDLNIIKSADVLAVIPGDTITYTIEIENIGNVIASNILLTDSIDSNTTFVAESVIVDGTPEPTFNPDNGFAIPDINSNDIIFVTFEVTVN